MSSSRCSCTKQGLKLGLDKESGYKNFIAKKQNQVPRAQWREMKRRVINSQIAAKIDIRPQDARDYYEKNAERMATQLHLLYIKVKGKEAADEALKKIRGGESFEAVARPLMGDTKVDGREAWDLGFVKWDQIPVDFFDAVYRLKPGEVSDVMGSQQAGFQIVKVLAKKKVPAGLVFRQPGDRHEPPPRPEDVGIIQSICGTVEK